MTQLQEPSDFVIGVDTHKHTHAASVVDTRGMELEAFQLATDATGFARMLTVAQRRAPGVRIWAIEGMDLPRFSGQFTFGAKAP